MQYAYVTASFEPLQLWEQTRHADDRRNQRATKSDGQEQKVRCRLQLLSLRLPFAELDRGRSEQLELILRGVHVIAPLQTHVQLALGGGGDHFLEAIVERFHALVRTSGPQPLVVRLDLAFAVAGVFEARLRSADGFSGTGDLLMSQLYIHT